MIPPELQATIDWLLKVEDFGTARSLARTVHRFLPPENPESSDFLAGALFRAKDYPAAVELAGETLRQLPDSPEAAFNAAKCLNAVGRPDQAEQLVRKALRHKPEWI